MLIYFLLPTATDWSRTFYTAMCTDRSQKGNRRDSERHFATKGMGRRRPDMDSKGAVVAIYSFTRLSPWSSNNLGFLLALRMYHTFLFPLALVGFNAI